MITIEIDTNSEGLTSATLINTNYLVPWRDREQQIFRRLKLKPDVNPLNAAALILRERGAFSYHESGSTPGINKRTFLELCALFKGLSDYLSELDAALGAAEPTTPLKAAESPPPAPPLEATEPPAPPAPPLKSALKFGPNSYHRDAAAYIAQQAEKWGRSEINAISFIITAFEVRPLLQALAEKLGSEKFASICATMFVIENQRHKEGARCRRYVTEKQRFALATGLLEEHGSHRQIVKLAWSLTDREIDGATK